MATITDNLIGADIAYLPILEGRTDLELVTGLELLDQSLICCIAQDQANPNNRTGGSRIYNRNVGLRLSRVLFYNLSPATREIVKKELLRIPSLEPRIDIQERDIAIMSGEELGTPPGDERHHTLIALIRYRVVRTAQQRNLIVPLIKPAQYQIVPNLEVLLNDSSSRI